MSGVGACPLCEPRSASALDPARAEEHLRAIRACNAKESLADFVKQAWHVLHPGVPLEWAWYLDAVALHVQEMVLDLLKVRRGELAEQRARRLVINVPPRTLKTEITTVFAPAWAWIHDPSLTIRCVSGNTRVTSMASRACRDLIGSKWYRDTFRPAWVIRDDIDAVGLFKNTQRGERWATTFNADVTGEGTDCIFNDDPHDAADVESDVMRQAVLDKWDMALASRVNHPTQYVQIGIMQRLREDDWTGHVLSRGGWEHLFIPMERDERECRTVFGFRDPRAVGELLHPERWTPEKLADERRRLGSYGYAGQLQQRPAPAEGGIFKRAWFQWIDAEALPARWDDLVISVDCAAKKTTDGSRTALLVVGRKGGSRIVLHAEAAHVTLSETLEAIERLRKKWDPKRILVEEKAAGTSVVEELQKRISIVLPINPKGDSKESRAMAVQPEVEAKSVALVKGAPWADELLHELCTFPMGQHDDQVDAFTQALNYWRLPSDAQRLLASCRW